MGTMIHAKLFPSRAADGPQGLSFRTFQLANKLRAPGFTNRKGRKFKPFSELEICGAAAGELGELANNVKKIRRGDVDIKDPGVREAIEKEIGDVITYLALLSNRFNIDMGEATRAKFNEVSDRVNSLVKL